MTMQSTTAAPSGRMFAPLSALGRAFARVPLVSQMLPIVGAFVCSLLAYARIGGDGSALGWSICRGIACFVLLFAQLRFIDDLDDLDRDHPDGECSAARRATLRRRLAASLAACIGLIVVLDVGRPHALLLAAAATVLGFAAPFAFKRLFPRSLGIGFFVFEGVPFLIFAYAYGFWRDASGVDLHPAITMCVSGLFWTAYEFWKFSRKAHTTAMQPYFLAPHDIRAALNGLLVLALVLDVSLAFGAGLSRAYTLYAAALPLAWLVWLNASWHDGQRNGRAPLWGGMSFAIALELGLFVELLRIPGSI
jgi:hypothetical protein